MKNKKLNIYQWYHKSVGKDVNHINMAWFRHGSIKKRYQMKGQGTINPSLK